MMTPEGSHSNLNTNKVISFYKYTVWVFKHDKTNMYR